MAKKVLPISLTENQYKFVKESAGSESMAAFIRKLVEKEMKKDGK